MPRAKKFGHQKRRLIRKKTSECVVSEKCDVSSSKKKIEKSKGYFDYEDNFSAESQSRFVIIDLNMLNDIFNNIAKCRYCDRSFCFDVAENKSSRRGLASSISAACKYCGSSHGSMTSNSVPAGYEVNLSFLPEAVQPGSNDLVNMQTFKYRILNDVMTKLNLTFQGINQWMNTHTPVNPEVTQVILRYIHKQDGIESILAQDFVKNERLNRLIQNMVKSGQSNTMSTLLAIDGLIGPKLNNGPQFEYKKYLENLKYSLSGEQGRYDREQDDLVKRVHVFAIRKVYQELENHLLDKLVDSKLMHCVYQVMSSILKESAGLELPKGPGIHLPDNVLKACSDVYWSNTTWEYFNSLVEILKSKIVVSTNNNNADSLTSNLEDGSAKKRKKEEITQP
ncbi:uncharacterized protein TNCT_422121 [Trichonephila clavata]|uniref:Uncharacterized protein n=3 Tax=Trichonephila clavata TaxID=2740835 RepID=A0A8X6JP79_TRICU|nr:uncharacterized protein TNCT_422121 [Trichonephila clavata]